MSEVLEQEFADAVEGLARAARDDLTAAQRGWVRDALTWYWERGEPIETSFPYELGDRTVRPAGYDVAKRIRQHVADAERVLAQEAVARIKAFALTELARS